MKQELNNQCKVPKEKNESLIEFSIDLVMNQIHDQLGIIILIVQHQQYNQIKV
jgi:hypothetical protein